MLNRFVAIAMITTVAGVGLVAQTPDAKTATAPKVMSWSFFSTGGYLGIQTAEVSNENFGKFGLPSVRGVAVEKVTEGSPAERGGIQIGDVIVRVNGEEITSSQKLTRLIGEISPDHTARITVFRNGTERELSVTVGKRPQPKFDEAGLFGRFEDFQRVPLPPDAPGFKGVPMPPRMPGEPGVYHFGNRRQIGAGLTPLTKELAEYFGVEGGAMVSSVRADSPAARSGLKVGDIIVEVDGKAVKGEGDIVRSMMTKKEGDVSLTFVRDRNRQTISVTPEEVKGGFNNYFEFPNAPDAPTTPGLMIAPRPSMPRIPGVPMIPQVFGSPGRVI